MKRIIICFHKGKAGIKLTLSESLLSFVTTIECWFDYFWQQ